MLPTEAEQVRISSILKTLASIRKVLNETLLNPTDVTAEQLYLFLASLKAIQGNANNAVSFVAKLLAKSYLLRVLAILPFDAASKAEGAPGLDVDVTTVDGERVVAEIKTTDPYLGADLGSKQREEFDNDFAKLNAAAAYYKFFFLTERRTFEVMMRKYAIHIPGVKVILLPSAEEYVSPIFGTTAVPKPPSSQKP